MKKKILALCLVVVLAVTAVTGATLAYFTDSDADVNVMTAGNIVIVQNETERDGTAYVDGQPLMPAVFPEYDWTQGGNPDYDSTMPDTDGEGNLKIWDKAINNEIDKVISVTNGGTLPAYIRTIVLMENTADNAICEKIHGLWNNSDGQYRQWVTKADGTEDMVTIDGTTYSIAVCTYNTAIEAGKTSAPSLMQLWLDPSADNGWYELIGEDGFTILAFSQAVQTTGFDNAETALNTAFGEVNSTNVANWVDVTPIKTSGLNNVIGGGEI